ncbi:MAG: aldo/keto reductase [Candidatus Hodarchaeales archaeon]|jgi:aryl-alcohol dehydrogenase (NADP+)
MKYVRLGQTGLEVSRICLGMMSYGDPSISKWTLPLDEARPIVKKALDLGINFFDTANVYSKGKSEEITGQILQEYRDEVVVATKVFFPMGGFAKTPPPNQSGLSRYHIHRAIDESLKRLNMEYVDLYQIHRLDPNVPLESILRTLNQLIDQGKALHIGASSMFAWQFTKSLWISDKYGLESFQTMQNHYNLLYREEEREMLPLCRDQKIGVIPWSPLARGFLSGRYSEKRSEDTARFLHDKYLKTRYFRPEDFKIVDQVVVIAQEKDITPVQVALAWLLSNEVITAPIVGITKLSYVEEIVGALDIKLTKDEIERLEEFYIPHPIIGHS